MNEDLKNKILKDFDKFKTDLLFDINHKINNFNHEIYNETYFKALNGNLSDENLICINKFLTSRQDIHWSMKAIYNIFYYIIYNIKADEIDEILYERIEDNKSDLLTELVDAKLIPDSYKSKIHSTRNYPI